MRERHPCRCSRGGGSAYVVSGGIDPAAENPRLVGGGVGGGQILWSVASIAAQGRRYTFYASARISLSQFHDLVSWLVHSSSRRLDDPRRIIITWKSTAAGDDNETGEKWRSSRLNQLNVLLLRAKQTDY
ncbi:hypothetical protein TcasGA2_TC012111 [Tribolium castaneum]|uniref:Uncharacterized protein n=1 Tax=Tribolium castaneum TaxID=7070 RepID=D6X1V6_TRICA|nr:hypothetical protein TcasGA2_TC012111 [Tribolium castaneum]